MFTLNRDDYLQVMQSNDIEKEVIKVVEKKASRVAMLGLGAIVMGIIMVSIAFNILGLPSNEMVVSLSLTPVVAFVGIRCVYIKTYYHDLLLSNCLTDARKYVTE